MRKPTMIIAAVLAFSAVMHAQSVSAPNEPSESNPYGRPFPGMEEQLSDFAPMIGSCDCKSVRRGTDGNWLDTLDMTWEFRYVMDGKAIQDLSWKSDGSHSMSVRQYVPDSSAWAVTFFSSGFPGVKPGTWIGGKSGDDVVLKMEQKSPNGLDGISRLTFYDISEKGYNWIGEWVTPDESFVYPFWKIFCSRE